ncbi:MAG: reverse transcriptase domain-containing protein [Bacilli bacterium]
MMNSSVKNTCIQPIGTTIYNFEITPTNSAISFKKSIIGLENLPHNDLENWIDDFRQTAIQCNWTDETAVATLKAVTKPNYWEILGSKKTLTSCLDSLLTYQYPQKQRFVYERQLNDIKQINFETIEEYVTQIKWLNRKYSLCANIKPDMQIMKEEEIFIKGLYSKTQIEMAKLGKHTQSEIFECISEVEQKILEQASRKYAKTDNYNDLPKKTVHLNTKAKYCSIHGTCKHSSAECRKNKFNLQKKENNNQSGLILRDSGPSIGGIELFGKIQNNRYKFLIDPGATRSFISKELMKDLNIKTTNLLSSEMTQIATGQIIPITKQTKINFELEKIPGKTFDQTFYIIEGDLAVILLGEPFLITEEVNIDYKYDTIRISDKEIILDKEYENFSKSPDRDIINNAMNINTKNDENIMDKINNLINSYKKTNGIIGRIPNKLMEIKLTKETLISKKPYSIPNKLIEPLKLEISRLKKLDIIQDSTSTYASPGFPILKRNGNIRLVVDYRDLNSITIKEAHPFLNLWDEIRSIPQCNIFSQLDLNMGYHQITIDRESRKYTAFSTSFGHFEYKRMPFGLCNAPRVFQRIMRELLGHLYFTKVFLDDILIHSKNISEHFEHLKTVLTILKENNVSINFEKSKFATEEVRYLGHIIDKNGIMPDTSNMLKPTELYPANSIRKIRRLCGYINWFRPYIPSISQKMIPISNLTKKTCKIKWGEEHSKIVDNILQEINQKMKLRYPNYNEPFNLDVDASELGMGGILYQSHGIIGIFSAKFSDTEIRYTVSEKEMLSVITALKKFKKIIYLSKIIIYSDHANLCFNTDLSTNRMQRWKLALMEYDYIIKHKKGLDNSVADTLSRCLNIQKYNHFFSKMPNYKLKYSGNNKIILPEDREREIIKKVHDILVHPGTNTIYNSLNKFFKIKNLKEKIDALRKHCPVCQENQITKYKYGYLTGSLESFKPFENISSDIYGPVPKDILKEETCDKIYLLTIIDRCSRWCEVFAIKKITPEEIIKGFNRWLKRNPKPKTCLTDNGTQYNSSKFKEFLNKKKILHQMTSPYNPEGNAISEHINQTISRVLKARRGCKLHQTINTINRVLQNSPHRTLGISPHEYRYKKSNFDPISRDLDRWIKKVNDRKIICSQANIKKMNLDRTYYKYTVGETIYIKNKKKAKLDILWKGPYKIVKIIDKSKVAYENENKIIKK